MQKRQRRTTINSGKGQAFVAFNPLRFVATPTTAKPRDEQVAEAAYFIALNRGFVPGYETTDWAAAEKEVEEANSKWPPVRGFALE